MFVLANRFKYNAIIKVIKEVSLCIDRFDWTVIC